MTTTNEITIEQARELFKPLAEQIANAHQDQISEELKKEIVHIINNNKISIVISSIVTGVRASALRRWCKKPKQISRIIKKTTERSDKIRYVIRYLDDEVSREWIAKDAGVTRNTVNNWINIYQVNTKDPETKKTISEEIQSLSMEYNSISARVIKEIQAIEIQAKADRIEITKKISALAKKEVREYNKKLKKNDNK